MPYGLKRFQRSESLHFITFSCFHRQPLLIADGAKETFEVSLERVRARHEARVYAYVSMPEHVHLIINEPTRMILGQVLKSLKQTTSRKLKGGREHFWQKRYYDANLGSEEMTDAIRYIHRNPVKRGLAATPEDYRWSSYHHYKTGLRGVVEIESEWTASWRKTHSSQKAR